MSTPDQWYAQPILTGRLVRLRPMVAEDASGYFEASRADGAGSEVFRWLALTPPPDVETAEVQILAALAARARGERFAYAQLDAVSGEFIGTTSYYEVDPDRRALGVGHTWLTRTRWRRGHNTESKLLMLSHAFTRLEAARVVFHTDIFNTRSQAAIERLGAVKEGVIRKHRIRLDGSWRDSVQYSITDDDWPQVQAKLTDALLR
ncbi:RimJ/RimL family protein N-acetyltransferase [Jatrophihabitans sp. GAS493]|uniref:GNAT family N-acetyltransferase n=1 Tax=Jatrophihabitans sp. GAS493 TaxID=1907575 RepID=UPI000BC043B5|nr:GNAT family protein [Jatrophihabitans sp. GAS493]SOD74134.1 RimJ/RimL family protein N-acetyltransferase [Jatrophihabitans sp. GAS493]